MTYEEKLREWVCLATREGSREALFLLTTDWKIEDETILFLNVHGHRTRGNEHKLGRDEISILGGVQDEWT